MVECKAHTSLKSLRKISKGLSIILAQTDILSEDWDRNKKVISGKYGYLNTAVNYPEILRETKLVKRLVKSFNNSREKIRKYRDLILSFNKMKPRLFKIKYSTKKIKTANKNASNEKKVISRLVDKLSPYNEREFKIISSRAFLSAHVREVFSEWEKDPSLPISITEASNEVINNLKYEYPKLQKWDYTKIVNCISDNWHNREEIQIELNREVLDLTKSTDLNQREEKNPDNDIKIEETNSNNEILESMIEENSDTLDWEKVLSITRYMNEAPPIILDKIDEVRDDSSMTSAIFWPLLTPLPPKMLTLYYKCQHFLTHF